MKRKNKMEKVISLILCLALLLPYVPVRAEGETEGEAGEWENASSEEAYGLKDPRLIREGWDEIYEFDTIWFGSYVQDDITGEQKNSIRWRVLDVSGNEALLVSDSILDVQPFHDVEDRADTMDAWWHDSTLRSWMNGYDATENRAGKDYSGEGDSFITKAFTTAEREALIPDTQKGEEGYSSLLKERISEPDTLDKVGLIGPAEINEKSYCLFNRYGGTASLNMRQKASNYVLVQSGALPRYWLRMMYDRNYYEESTIEYTEQLGRAFYWTSDEEIKQKANNVIYYKNEAHGVVARIRLDLSKTDLWSFAGTTTNEGLDDFSDAAPMPVRVDYSRQVLPASEGLKLSEDGKTALSYEGEDHIVVIPEGVEELDPDFYLNSVEIWYLHLPSTLKTIPDHCFDGEIQGKGDKYKRKDFTYVRFNDPSASQLKTIGEYAFHDQYLFEVLLPEGLEEIKAHAFDDGFSDANDSSVASVGNHTNMNFPDGLKVIGENAFRSADIQYVRFGSGLESLGKGAFLYSDIASVDLSRCKKLKTIPEDSFRCDELNAGLLNVVLNEGLEEIGAGAFAVAGNDSKPIRIVVPDSVKSIGDEAFAGGSIEKLILPETVDYFGEHVISLAGDLHYLRLPKNLTKIDGILRKLKYEDSIPRILVCEGDVSEVIWGGAAENTYIPQYIIYGKSGTALEETARENNLTFYDCTKNPPPDDYEISITERDLNVVADGDALCSYEENTLKLLGKGTYRISMKEGVSSTTDCIVVGNDCTIELDNVDIRTDSKKDYGNPDWPYGGFAGIWIPTNSGAKVTIRFKGTNTVKGSGSLIGIMKYSRSSAGQLTLVADSGTDADVLSCNGIGYDDLSGNRPQDEYGNRYYHSHNITIESGTVKSSFGNCGCSNFQINGGVLETDSLGNLKVNGGTVRVKNGVDHFSTVRINDGDVSLTTIESESKIQMYGGRLNIKDYKRMDGELEYHGGYVFSGDEQIYPSPTPTEGEKKPVASISLNKSELKLKAGESGKLTATILPEDAEDKSVEWSSDNTPVATVDASGNVTAVAEGSAKIMVTAKDGSGVSASCTVTVEKAGEDEPAPSPSPAEPIPGSGEARDPQPVIEEGETLYLVKGQSFTLAKGWSSRDRILSVSKTGVAKAKNTGMATLVYGDNEKTIHVSITAPTITSRISSLPVGTSQEIALNCDSHLPVLWYSAAPNIATVDQGGHVTGLSKGTAKVTAMINGKAYICSVKVTEEKSLPERDLYLNVKKAKNVKIKGLKKTVWTISGNEAEGKEIVKVSGSKLKGLKAGDVKLVCEGYVLNVHVEDPVLEGSAKPCKMTINMKAGEVSEKPVKLLGVKQTVIFKSNKPLVAYIDDSGLIHARSKGKAKITAKINGKSLTIIVTVKQG
ncbi:MAG: Ig-like domain-containing protein [Lachnospiraceae bacterium]|nr:Ig-like domain-containing protein [Lachnospiraceae bacterium]